MSLSLPRSSSPSRASSDATRRRRFAGPLVVSLLLAFAVGGCASVSTQPAQVPTEQAASHPLIVEAGELARAGAGLDGAARQANDRRIDALLSQLDGETLAREANQLPVGDPLYDYIGRALLLRGLPLPRPFDRNEWQFEASTRPPAEADGYRPPTRMAVLLPLSGRLSNASAPVRDGFLAGYYGEQRRRPEVEFYDTSGTAGGTLAAYDKAVADGVDFVLGPLGRDEVSALFGRGTLSVPVLALNRGTSQPPAGNASFSLSPEDEGIAAAEYLLARGATRVLVVAANDDTQRRAVDALRERLGERGATVTDVVSAGVVDMTPFVQKEGGVDAVFLAIRGNAARALIPSLAMAGLVGKPLVATTQLQMGTGKPEEDRVLDGIAFPTETWTSGNYVRGLPTAASVGQRLSTARGPAARLFAFGYDAWLLTGYLEKLALEADGQVAGATGTLRIDGFGNIQRTPAWSTFSGGRVTPLAPAR